MANNPGDEDRLPTDARQVYTVAYDNAIAAGKAPALASKAAWVSVRMGWEERAGVWVRLDKVPRLS